MQDILNIQTRLNEPGKGFIYIYDIKLYHFHLFYLESDLECDGPQNWSWRFQWSQLTSDIKNRFKKLTEIYGRDLKYGKSIPPDDMIMKDTKQCIIQ